VAAGLIGVISTSAGRASGADVAPPRLGPPTPFSLEALQAHARALAKSPYRPTPSPLADRLASLDFDAIGRIRYRSEAALWRDRPDVDSVEFFHLGKYAQTPVTISVVDAGQARQILYSPALFDIPSGDLASQLPADLGFAGFRVMNHDGQGDWIAYLGASYFRAATPFNQYGLSARGLAIDTGAGRPEEFPRFTAFWLSHDPTGNLVVCALLESASVVGAYRIIHQRDGGGLTQTVEATLNFRKPVEILGLAPLTSMFWYGPTDRAKALDWRPQIHDSDGLAIWTGAGERIWRPLTDPARVTTNAFIGADPKGFGLMQRDRAFEDYQDDGAFYDRRPSAWVEPIGQWGAGSVKLVEIPTAGETDDNIVAFWSPERPVKVGDALSPRYRLHWTDEEPNPLGVGRTVATRQGVGGRPGVAAEAGGRKFVVDFSGGQLATLTRQSGVTPVVTAGGQSVAAAAYPVVGTGRWRLMFDITTTRGNTVELRAFLRLGAEALTETWVFPATG
jgi:periplasmic glucans biosynthesis protein